MIVCVCACVCCGHVCAVRAGMCRVHVSGRAWCGGGLAGWNAWRGPGESHEHPVLHGIAQRPCSPQWRTHTSQTVRACNLAHPVMTSHCFARCNRESCHVSSVPASRTCCARFCVCLPSWRPDRCRQLFVHRSDCSHVLRAMVVRLDRASDDYAGSSVTNFTCRHLRCWAGLWAPPEQRRLLQHGERAQQPVHAPASPNASDRARH